MVESVLEHKIYNVRPGDTLLQIAALAKLKYEDLLALNPQVKNPNLIFAGQALILPKDVSRQKLIVAASNQIFTGDEPAWLKIARHEIGVAEKDPGVSRDNHTEQRRKADRRNGVVLCLRQLVAANGRRERHR